MSRLQVRGSDSLKRKLDALGERLQAKLMTDALVSGALIIQNDAKRRAPYKTGNLRRSIHIGGSENLNPDQGAIVQRTGEEVPPPQVDNDTARVWVGTDVEYASSVELGAEGRRPQPFLRPAADTTRSDVSREVAEALRDLIKAAIR